MTFHRAALTISLIACGSPPSPVTPPSPLPGSPPYAAVFDNGRSLRYRLVRTVGGHKEHEVELTCKAVARDLGAYRVAQLACGERHFATLNGVFIATHDGLWAMQGADLPTDAAVAQQLIVGPPFLAAVPVEQPSTGDVDFHGVAMRGGAWCVEWGTRQLYKDEVCFGPRGIVKIDLSRVADGVESEETFELL